MPPRGLGNWLASRAAKASTLAASAVEVFLAVASSRLTSFPLGLSSTAASRSYSPSSPKRGGGAGGVGGATSSGSGRAEASGADARGALRALLRRLLREVQVTFHESGNSEIESPVLHERRRTDVRWADGGKIFRQSLVGSCRGTRRTLSKGTPQTRKTTVLTSALASPPFGG